MLLFWNFVLCRLKGTDPENGELTYSISGEYFRVNKRTGDITLIKELDRENEASIDVIISLTGKIEFKTHISPTLH